MSGRTEELERRRLELQARCAQQRGEIGADFATLERQFGLVDRGIQWMRRISAAPILIGLAVGVMFLFGPRRIVKWAGQAMLMTSAMKRLSRLAR